MNLVFCILFLIASYANGQVNFTSAEIVGRPTNSSITINVIADAAIDVYFQYGTQSGNYTNQTSIISASANQPIETVINGLQSNTLYYYRMAYRLSGTTTWNFRNEYYFRTQRPATSTFTFDIISDEHLNMSGLTTGTIFENTINNVKADNPDFVISLGDKFSASTTQSGIESDYKGYRETLATLLRFSPLFYVLGNHENEEGWFQYTTSPDRRIWGVNARKKYLLNPVPDAFYSGDSHNYGSLGISGDGLRESYYSFEWGDALFVFLDPFWNTNGKPHNATVGNDPNPSTVTNDIWNWTLGIEQYTWLYQTLSNSNKPYKFVFAHQVAGGTTTYGRSGVKAIDAGYEWGGGTNWNQTGSDWSIKRPASAGWIYGPVHKILVDHHASAFFHGHDHCYVKESRDGIVYQECPQAGTSSGNGFYSTSPPSSITDVMHAYYDPAGVNYPNGGHLRVSVSPSQATVEYVRTFTSGGTNGSVSHTYNILPYSSTPANNPPVANAGPDQTLTDTDNSGSENVTLDGSGSTDSDGTITSYTWKENGSQIGSGINPTISFSIGTHNIELTVTDNNGASNSSTVTIKVLAPTSNSIVNLIGSYSAGLTHSKEAGNDRALVFTAHAEHYGTLSLTAVYFGGQSMTKIAERTQGSSWNPIYTAIFILNEAGINAASGNTFTPNWNITSYWGSTSTPSAVNYSSAFFSGVNQNSLTGDVAVNGINNQSSVSTSSLGTNAGDMVIVASTCSNNGSYSLNNGFSLGIELAVMNADGICGYKPATGVNETPRVTESISGNHAIAGFVLKSGNQVIQNIPPVADAGPDQTVIDYDNNGTENVTLDGSGSSDSDGSITGYVWTENGTQIGTGINPVVSFTTGTHIVDLTVTDDDAASSTSTVTITVIAPASNTTVALTGTWVQGLSHSVEPGNNRALIFVAHAENYGSMSLTSVLFGGQPMTKVIEYLNSSYSNQVYTAVFILNENGIANASGNSFSPTWNVTSLYVWNTTNTPNSVNYSSAYFSGVNQLNLTGDKNSKGGNFQKSVSTNPLYTNTGDMVIVASTCSNSGTYTVNNGFSLGIEISMLYADGITGNKSASGVNEIPSVTHSTYGFQSIAGLVLNAIPTVGSTYNSGRNANENGPGYPESTGSFSVYPNPTSGYTTIDFTVTQEGPVSLKIFSIDGKQIRNLIEQIKSPGAYKYCWDGKTNEGIKVQSGLYFCIYCENQKQEVLKIVFK